MTHPTAKRRRVLEPGYVSTDEYFAARDLMFEIMFRPAAERTKESLIAAFDSVATHTPPCRRSAWAEVMADGSLRAVFAYTGELMDIAAEQRRATGRPG